ncbi:MAG: cobyric acid synthase [Desulfarculaceae bacterium]|nr:cobyric acid synthase [Desulfarculaceae bacterium]
MKKANHLAVFGTGSDVGKSIVAAALCRSLADRKVNVAPFKAQNMSNNSGITPEGLEMGRAQIVQSEAARIPPNTDMNPILLKPTADNASQVVVNGKVYEDLSAVGYHKRNKYFFKEACSAFDRLSARQEMIVMEGAGSCAEVNLMHTDIVNFRMAAYARADVVLVADIHKGGVFAQILGTLECLPSEYREMVRGFIVNRFRGDPELFKEGVDWIERKTGKPVFGVLPWYSHFRIDAEDSVEIETCSSINSLDPDLPAIGVIRLPHISNFTDMHSLSEIDGLQVAFVDRPEDLSVFKAVILPGSKSTRADMEWLDKSGIAESIKRYVRSGGHVLGICGGYQMLGRFIRDDAGVEGEPGCTNGLGLLNIETSMSPEKTTTRSTFSWDGIKGEGYEIHMGKTRSEEQNPWLLVHRRNDRLIEATDGCRSADGKVAGTYIHGLFDTRKILEKWLAGIGISDGRVIKENKQQGRDHVYALLKSHFEENVDVKRLLESI